jgi:hypothetical protein
MRCNPFVKQREAELALLDRLNHELKSSLAADFLRSESSASPKTLLPQDDRPEATTCHQEPYLCSKSTGAVTSCTRKYLASAGYFRATASYIA